MITSVLQATDTINSMINTCVSSLEMREAAGVTPVVFWEGVSIDAVTTNKPCISVSHMQRRDSEILFMGFRKMYERQMVVMEIRVPTQVKNGSRVCSEIARVLEKSISIKSINGVDILNTKVRNGGVEGNVHVSTLVIYYEFVRSLE